MKWENLRRSANVFDTRGRGGKTVMVGGGLGALVLVVVSLLFGVDLGGIGGFESSSPGGGRNPRSLEGREEADARQALEERGGAPADVLGQFVSTILASTEDVWKARLPEQGVPYEEPVLVLFTEATRSACGFAQAAMGPFYCPSDKRVYIDLAFYEQLRRQLGAPGDFAQAYVIAHEVGHHVQNLLGTLESVERAKAEASSQAEANALQVRVELQADCYAGLWAHVANRDGRLLEQGDVEEALTAASAIGDDTLQRRAQGRIVPDAFTHGSAVQRTTWFRTGLEHGSLAACDTFEGDMRFASGPRKSF